MEDVVNPPPYGKPKRPVMFGGIQAKVIQLACEKPPEGHSGWSFRLLADTLVELKAVLRFPG